MSTCVLDTDVVIAALDRADAHHAEARNSISEMLHRNDRLLICTVNYAEALVRPALNPDALEAAVDAIASLGIKPVAPTGAIALDAARHRSQGISLADGFALATAQAERASVASFDRRVPRAAEALGINHATPP